MPSKRTAEIENDVLSRIEDGEPLREICRQIDISYGAWYDWVEVDEALASRFRRARLIGGHAIADRSRRTLRGFGPDQGGDSTGETLRDKAIAEHDLKLLARWFPKDYGERTTTELTGANGGPVDITDTAAAAKIAALLEAAKARKVK